MIDPSEINGLMTAVKKNGETLSDEILTILLASPTPLSCKQMFAKSKCASDASMLSREVYRLANNMFYVEVVDKQTDGRVVSAFYRLTKLGKQYLNDLANGVSRKELATPAKAPVKPTAMHSIDRGGDLRKLIHNIIVSQPGISRTELITRAAAASPQFTEEKVKSTLGNLGTKKFIKNDGNKANLRYYEFNATILPAAPKTEQAPTKPVTAKRTSPDLESAIKAKQCAELLIEDMRALNKTNNVLVKEILSDLLHPASVLHSKLTKIADHLTSQS
jgi:hypothetical protein